MAVYEVTKMWSTNGSNTSLSNNGKNFQISFQEAYQVTCDPDTTILEIYNAPGIPAANSLYPDTFNVYCDSCSPKQVSPIMWIVDVSYSGEVSAVDGNVDLEENPLSKPPTIDWTDAETDEQIDVDADGNAICTINGEPIEGVTTKLADQVVTIQRNYAFFSPAATAAYRRSVSSDVFLGYPAGTAKMIRFSAKLVRGQGIGYWDVTASIQFRLPYRTTNEKAWYARVLNQGYYVKVGSIIRRALDTDLNTNAPGEPMVKPVLLKTDGTVENNPANATWLEFKRYNPLPYNALGLL
jgi:hypothetical protein